MSGVSLEVRLGYNYSKANLNDIKMTVISKRGQYRLSLVRIIEGKLEWVSQ